MSDRLRAGQFVRVRLAGSDGNWCEARVELASDTTPSQSVALILADAVRTAGGGIVMGVLPLTVDYDHETVRGLEGSEYEIEVLDSDRVSMRQAE